MKSFIEFLQEKNITSLDAETHIYQNPSSSDLVSMSKYGIKMVRYLADSSDQTVYVWDASKYIHYDGIDKLKSSGFLRDASDDEWDPKFYKRFLTGTAQLVGGELIHHSSDTLDTQTRVYIRSKLGWNGQAKALYPFFKNEIDDLLKRFSFANQYIKDCTGPNSSLMKLKRSIQ